MLLFNHLKINYFFLFRKSGGKYKSTENISVAIVISVAVLLVVVIVILKVTLVLFKRKGNYIYVKINIYMYSPDGGWSYIFNFKQLWGSI